MQKYYKLIWILVGFATILFGTTFCYQPIMETFSELITDEYKSKIVDSNKFSWKIEMVQIDENADIKNICFFDENTGYGISKANFVTTIHKTSDGGRSWKKAGSIESFYAEDIFFTTQIEGFVAGDNHIMKTEDGGQNWKIIYTSDSVIFEKLAFSSNGSGVAVGKRKTPSDSENLILLTNDKGEKWNDISVKLNAIALTVRKDGKVGDFLTDVVFPSDSQITVVSRDGKIYDTTNQGKSWNLISKLVNEPSQTGIWHIGKFEDKGFWIAGGTNSIEGKFGIIAIINKNLGWNRYKLNNYFFSDVEFFSNDKVFAVGSVAAKKNLGETSNSNKGVILYSTDEGKSWSIIYENQAINEFTSIAKLSENKLLVAGENGIGVLLEKP